MLSDALELPRYPFMAKSLAPAGLLLAVLALIYFIIYVRQDTGFLNVLTPLRFLMSSAFCVWSYYTSNPAVGNGLVFAFAFGDMIFQVGFPHE